uniref:Vacuolar protein-sorting-associated protein 36 n=1 Tax=Amphora coffeiformis TaxID=265554 RepID=A0A7S3L415_9STRA|mmetsp:Transcript_23135/g.44056  ORF Transcript_23135/g.44056 Transcript_23135/m.44056 type:complete len:423 (+) Transcript_23135:92-1360(+)|eukprot:scaffold184_cov179-Amphora_coffeaeformis.AAC.1
MSRTTWSPIDCLPAAKLTGSGLLDADEHEVILWARGSGEGGVSNELRSTDAEPMQALTPAGNLANTQGKTWVDRSTDISVTITTHRILFQQTEDTTSVGVAHKGRFLHLSHLLSCHLEASMFKAPRILLMTVLGELFLIFRGDKATQNAKDALHNLETALRRQEWETAERLERQSKQANQTEQKRRVGVDAIVSRNKARHELAASVTESAFTGDAESLLQEAAALVKIIQKYVATVDRHEGSNNEDNDKLAALLQNMGMTTALRKTDFHGREKAYFAQLSRQLADFLRPKLKESLMMTLTDVYCIYNRARGTNLISPEDLLQAVDRLEDLKLGLSARTFPSGLRVIQDAALTQDAWKSRLVEAAKNGCTSNTVAHELHLSWILANELLLQAEQEGALVRDETSESLRFYPNRFEEWAKELKS